MLRLLRSAGVACTLCACASVDASAQTPPFVFTMTTPVRTSSETTLQGPAVVEERGIALWDGAASDFGLGVARSGALGTIRSITVVRRRSRSAAIVGPCFNKSKSYDPFIRPLPCPSPAAGPREEWDAYRVLIGRVLVGSDIGRARLQGSLVMERAVSSSVRHDAADDDHEPRLVATNRQPNQRRG